MDESAKGRGLQAGPDARGEAEGVGAPTAEETKKGSGVVRRARQMTNGIKRAHGWRVQEGKRDGG